jgi:hypothetical protein
MTSLIVLQGFPPSLTQTPRRPHSYFFQALLHVTDIMDIDSRTPPVSDKLRAGLAPSLTQMTVVRRSVSASHEMQAFCSP